MVIITSVDFLVITVTTYSDDLQLDKSLILVQTKEGHFGSSLGKGSSYTFNFLLWGKLTSQRDQELTFKRLKFSLILEEVNSSNIRGSPEIQSQSGCWRPRQDARTGII